MKANIEKRQIFHKMKYDLKGHKNSQKLNVFFKGYNYFWVVLVILILINTIERCKRYT